MKGKWVHFIALTFALSFLLCIFSLGWALYDYFSGSVPAAAVPPASGVSETDRDGFDVLALGDSLTRGTGDAAGKGYIGYLMDHLKEKSNQKLMNLYNLGINGQTSGQLANQLKHSEIQRQVKNADIIIITIGGNDLFRGGRTIMNLNIQNVKELEEKYLQNLNVILSDIRSLNTEAAIFLIGLYNPFIQLDDAEITSKIVRDWNYRSADVSAKYPKTVFVPTFDLFQLKVDDYLSADKFHPNAGGYRMIAERVASLVTW